MNAIDNVLNLQMCSSCGETPCVASNYIQIAQDYKSNHAKDNKSIHYFAYQKYIRDTYGILGKGQCVKLPHCVESALKSSFPNKDEALFVGFRDSSIDYW